nr:SulP family inorganic anion transporter [Paraburkholderia hospita]
MLSRTYERRNGISVNRNRECIALGLSNMAAGVLQGFAVSASGSRTPVAESAGAKTQVTGVIAAAVVALLRIRAALARARAAIGAGGRCDCCIAGKVDRHRSRARYRYRSHRGDVLGELGSVNAPMISAYPDAPWHTAEVIAAPA